MKTLTATKPLTATKRKDGMWELEYLNVTTTYACADDCLDAVLAVQAGEDLVGAGNFTYVTVND